MSNAPTNGEEFDDIKFAIPDAEDKMTYADDLSKDKNNVLRVEENVGRSWSGVSSCGHSDRIQAEAQTALNEWVKQKIFEYRTLHYLRAGAGEGRASWTDYNPPFGARSCHGSLLMLCYIEFAKQG